MSLRAKVYIYDSLSPYSQSVVDVLSSCDYILPASSSPVFQKNFDQFYSEYEISTPNYPHPMIAIKTDGKTALQLFDAFRNKFNANTWAQLLKN